ncbi:MAG: carboxypeptidase M32 [Candidatus Methanodesulfokora washburnensis]|jgi:carboxypeptidase Taq
MFARTKEILKKARTIWALDHASSLMDWDLEVNMPVEGVQERGIAASEIAVLRQKLLLDEELSSLIEKAEKEELDDYERGLLRVLKREIRIAKSLPPDLVQELTRVTQEAKVVWREAREKDDYSKFKPYLERIVELERKVADFLGYEKHPYDALLDLHEEGLKTDDVQRIFSSLEPGIRKVLSKITNFYGKHWLEEQRYDVEAMKLLNLEVLRILGYPLGSRSRIDVSAHPFTIHMGIRDVRITTRYEGYDFKRSFFSTLHEFGHALYELQVDDSLMATPLSKGVSLGIHESQSRFWENMIGRSMEFVKGAENILKDKLGFLRDVPAEEIYRYFNIVRPSLIRTEADEVTYNLHIILRFKIEFGMIDGSIKVDEIPEEWDNLMEELLGIRPENYRDGVLQDIHWSMGDIGYFPTYTLGNVISAQIREHMMREIPDLHEKVRKMDFEQVKEYLKERIHRWGSVYSPKELIKRSFKEEIRPEPFLDYLEKKYLSVHQN